MPSRGRHQSTSKECRRTLRKIEAIPGVVGVIIGMSFGGKSLGQGMTTGSVRIQRTEQAGLKAVIQSEKGLQEIFILTESDRQDEVVQSIARLQ
jgi:hypothetical protein